MYNISMNVTLEELEEAYKHNMIDMLRNAYYYVRDLSLRNLILITEGQDVKLSVFCDDYRVFELRYECDNYFITFTNFVRYTANRIVVPDDIDIFCVIVNNEYNVVMLREYLENSGRKLHCADFIYKNDIKSSLFLHTEDLYNGYKYVIGEADGISKERIGYGIGYCDNIEIRLYDYILNKKSIVPECKIRHMYGFDLTFWNTIGKGKLIQFVEWINGTEINSVSINIKTITYECSYLKNFLAYKEELKLLIAGLFISGVKSVLLTIQVSKIETLSDRYNSIEEYENDEINIRAVFKRLDSASVF